MMCTTVQPADSVAGMYLSECILIYSKFIVFTDIKFTIMCKSKRSLCICLGQTNDCVLGLCLKSLNAREGVLRVSMVGSSVCKTTVYSIVLTINCRTSGSDPVT